MKKYIFILAILTSAITSIQAQQKIKGSGKLATKNLTTKSYDQIHVKGVLKVVLIKGQEGKIEISGDDNLIEYVEAWVENEKLTIKMKSDNNFSFKKPLLIKVPIETISELSLAGPGEISSNNQLTNNELMLNLKGSGDINLAVSNHKIQATVIGSGDINLQGKTNYLEAVVKGSGDIVAKNLTSEDANLTVIGSGDITAKATNQVQAQVKGSGDIYVTGNPKNVTQNTIGSGDISIK